MSVLRKVPWLPGACMAMALLLGGSGPLFAQGVGTVYGVVRSAEGAPISGAQVFVEQNRSIGSLTNADGRFVLPGVPAGTYTIVAQFLGYTSERRTDVSVTAGQSTQVEFQLRTEVLSLAELVVTGVTEATSRAMVPFTVGRVGSEKMPVPATDAVASMQGKLAGVSIVGGSQPGSGSSILFRTATSINRNTTPLIVVDGVILSESSVDLASLDIESIEVVKGAAGASLYGSRAAAGVLQIRTRRGSSLPTDQTRFTVRSEYGMSDIPHPIEWAQHHNFRMNESGQYLDRDGNVVATRGEAATTEYGFQDQRYPGTIYDHIESLFNPGDYQVNSVTIGHNSGNTSWLASASTRNEAGVVVENSGYQRNDFRLNLDHRLQNDLSVSISAAHMRSERDNLPGNTFFDFIHQSPDVDLLQPDPDGTPYAFQPDEDGIRANPLYQIFAQQSTLKRLRTMASTNLRYNPVAWLAFDLNASYDRSDRQSHFFLPKGKKSPDYPTGGPGFAGRTSGATDGINASLGTTLSRDFGLLRTRASLRGLIEREDNVTFTAEGQDLAVGGIGELEAIKVPEVGSGASSIRSSGYFMNTDLSYNDKYIVNALVRRDGSSLFGPEERWHTYYRVSGGYRMAQEPWWPIEQINELKLHYSRGTAGGRPNFADRFETFSLQTGGGLALATLGNRFLKPERTTEQEFGVDMVALQRLSLQLSYATQITEDQLVQVPLPSLYGFQTQWQNAGTIEGHTYEGTLEARLVDTDDLSWSLTLVGDRSRNRIVGYDRPCHTSGRLAYRCAGEVLGVMYGNKLLTSHSELPTVHASSRDAFQVNDDGLLVPVGAGNSYRDGVADSLWGSTVTIDGVDYPWGMPIKAANPDGTAAAVRIGDGNPDFKWGLSNQVQWRNFNLFVLVDGQIGGDVYNNTKQRMYQYTRHADVDQPGKPEELKKPAAYYASGLYNGNVVSSWFIEDGSYTKLREVSLRYRLDASRLGLLSSVGLDRATLALIGRNLFTLTGYSGYDPEIGTVLNRIDDFDYPIYRTLTASVELQF